MTWGPWIEHDGKGCPVPGQLCQVVYRHGGLKETIAGSGGGLSWDWTNYGRFTPGGGWIDIIVRYRVRRPKGMDVLDAILKDLDAPVPVRQPEDA